MDAQKQLDEIELKEKIIEEADKRYALKWSEKVLLAILGSFGAAILVKLVAVIHL